MTGAVTLEYPFPKWACEELWRWLNAPRDPNFDDYGPRTVEEFRLELDKRRRLECTWGISLGGELVGYLGFIPQTQICGAFHGLVIEPEKRGMGIGAAAVAEAIGDLRVAGFEKFMVWVFADNHGIAHLFGKLGFTEEGYISGATRRSGEPLDMRVLCLPGIARGGD
jgi:RimJ/RimL family protein N-acetyltransferase